MATYDDLNVDIGNAPNDDQGDPLRTAFDKINQRFAELRVFLNNRGDWAPNTAYTADPNRDWVIVDGVGYLATSNHTSGATFAADLADGKWVEADALLAIAEVDTLRDDLASSATGKGAELVAGVDLQLADYAALRAYNGTKKRVYITGALGSTKPAGIAGVFQHDATDTSSSDNGGTVIVGVDGRRWKRDFSGSIRFEWFSADGTRAGDSAALKAAIAAADPAWAPVELPARRILWDGSMITNDRVKLWGSGMPAVNAINTTLVGGTIIEGSVICTGDYIDLRDFGTDLGSATSAPDGDAIKCLAGPLDSGKVLHTENLIGLCKARTSTFHALLFEGYASHTGGNLHGVRGFFGVVLKTRGVRLSSIKATDNNDTGAYFKSDNLYGQCSDVQVDSIDVDGATYAVRLQADSALMDNIQINNIRAQGCSTPLLVQLLNATDAAFGTARVGSIMTDNSASDAVFIYNLKPGGRMDAVEIGSIVSEKPASKVVTCLTEAGAEIQSVTIHSIYASYDTIVSDSVLDGAVFVGGGVKKTSFGTVALLVDHGRSTRLGAVNYPNAGGVHTLGVRRARVLGAGRPLNGYSVQSPTGTSAAVTVPRNESGKSTSLVKLTHTAPITITSFASPATNDLPFEPGHVLTLQNATSHLVTVANNAPGGIVNAGYTSVTIGENGVRSWVMCEDAVWRSLS